MKRFGILAVIFLLVPRALFPQVEAQQGSNALRVENRFASPMVLTLSLEGVAGLPYKEAKRYPGIRSNVCDDAFFSVFEVSRRRGLYVYRQRPTTLLHVYAVLSVRPSFDRDVDLRLEVIHGERVISETWLRHLDAEEGKTLKVEEDLSLDAETEELLASGDPPQLRVTMYVREREGF